MVGTDAGVEVEAGGFVVTGIGGVVEVDAGGFDGTGVAGVVEVDTGGFAGTGGVGAVGAEGCPAFGTVAGVDAVDAAGVAVVVAAELLEPHPLSMENKRTDAARAGSVNALIWNVMAAFPTVE